MGDACEMLVAAEMTLAGVPALKVPDNWPAYDIIAQPLGGPVQRISVKSRNYKANAGFLIYDVNDKFDWIAMVLLECPHEDTLQRQIYIVPKKVADKRMSKNKEGTKTQHERRCALNKISSVFSKYLNNFDLSVK